MTGSASQPLLATLAKKHSGRIPFWFMRQAGRYLPEYRELRGKAKSFLDFCYTPAMACEATLQPIRRFGMDAAIIFSDILVVPDALGVKVWFEEGHGPRLEPVRTEEQLTSLAFHADKLAPVYEALAMTRAALPKETALIGFAGAPWTLACYMIEGRSSRDFEQARARAVTQPQFFSRLIDHLVEAVIEHTVRQVQAGAEVIQLFDSWAGVLSETQFAEYAIAPVRCIVDALHARCPGVPVIGFPRQVGANYFRYVRETNIDAVSIDASMPLAWAVKELQPYAVLQGNLDPLLLANDLKSTLTAAERIISNLGHKPFVFNLGHGILPHTPVEHMQALCDFLRDSAVPA